MKKLGLWISTQAAVRDGQILPNEFGVVKFGEIVSDNEEENSKSIVVSTLEML